MRVAVVGATGAVGSTMLGVMRERSFPADEVVPFASERSAGTQHRLGRRQAHGPAAQRRGDPGLRPRAVLGRLRRSARSGRRASPMPGAVVVDNSSQWRMHDDVPLVVSEVNPEALDGHRGIVANPNCTTMQTVVALEPILERGRHRAGGDVELPGRVGHGPEGGRGAARPGGGADRRPRRSRRRASIRTRSPSTCCRRSRPSRTATTTRPRSASACARRARSSAATTSACPPPARACRCTPATRCRRTCRRASRSRRRSAASCSPRRPA